jgi:hypothetical protein
MRRRCPASREALFTIVAVAALVFGVVTLAAGARVLRGADPGYVVFRPLLIFNTTMGLAYIAVGVLAQRRSAQAVRGAALIALVNLGVLAALALGERAGAAIAAASLLAMGFRSAVWALLFLVLRHAGRRPPEGEHGG